MFIDKDSTVYHQHDIDFDKLHGEIKQVLRRQKELRSKGVVENIWWPAAGYGQRSNYEDFVNRIVDSKPGNIMYKFNTPLVLEQFELSYLSRRITVLCAILAQAKGQVRHSSMHKKFYRYSLSWVDGVRRGDDIEDKRKAQLKLIGDEWRQFVLLPAEREKKLLASGYVKETVGGVEIFTRPAPPVRVVGPTKLDKKSFLSRMMSKLV